MKKNIRGFTLIELLVVISIIGILAALFTVSFGTAQKQARDTERKSDLSQYRNALETYANRSGGIYPAEISSIDTSGTLCTALGLSSCPKDPKDPTIIYHYCSSTNGTGYALWASLESASLPYWIVCSDGRSGSSTNVPTCGGDFACNLP